MTQAAYFNVHGQPLTLSARDAVIAIHPEAVAIDTRAPGGSWLVRRNAGRYATIIGTGANEESAWRDAWSRMLAEDVAKEARS